METLESKTQSVTHQDEARAVAHNRRRGVVLFILYTFFYGGFMALSAFAPETMSEPFLGGVNLAVVYGLSLIVVPLILALIYMKLCRKTSQ